MSSQLQKQLFLGDISYICTYKPCAAKAPNISIAWHTHTHFYTLNSRDLEMFVCLCQHLTVIIFNHSHTCLSLKIVSALLRRLFQAMTAFPEPCLCNLPSPGSCGDQWLTSVNNWVLPQDAQTCPAEWWISPPRPGAVDVSHTFFPEVPSSCPGHGPISRRWFF